MKAIVVGAGVLGAATADALVARGWDVTVVEQYAPANARGSSGDRTRLLRLGHGEFGADEDLHYIRSAARGVALWRALDEQCRGQLLEPTGLVWLAADDGGPEDLVAQRMDAAGAPYERLTPAATAALFPGMAVDDLAFSLYEPDACVIRAGDAVAALLRRATDGGARLVLDRARPPARTRWPSRPARRAPTRWSGPAALARRALARARAGAAVVAGRAALERAARLARRPGLVRRARRPVRVPGRRRARDQGGQPHARPDARPRSRRARARARDGGRGGRVPGAPLPPLAGAGLLWARVMPYEMTPDSHFVAGPADTDGHWLLGGGSGHAFKHAPGLGEHLADLIEGRDAVVPMWRPRHG